jgi:hypothetical protein
MFLTVMVGIGETVTVPFWLSNSASGCGEQTDWIRNAVATARRDNTLQRAERAFFLLIARF